MSRDFVSAINQYLENFTVVVLTGARQTGKTTLLKSLLQKTHQYVLLENPDTRALAINDPRAFLQKYADSPLVIDEFQYAPELLNYLQEYIDQNRDRKGFYVLTGSQNFNMMEQITQSLAGRIGIAALYGLSSLEIQSIGRSIDFARKESVAHIILRGTYPELWKEHRGNNDPFISLWMASYTQTFLERDLRQLAQVGKLSLFERFLRQAAIRTAQVMNVSQLANDIGVSSVTCHHWLSILEKAMIIKFVDPFHANISSRIKKAKKMYFLDTGLASYLMGFRNEQSILESPHFGSLFETQVYSNFIKLYANKGLVPEHYYMQTRSKVGVDLIIQENQKLRLIQIKATQTYKNDLCEQLVATANELGKHYQVESNELLILQSDNKAQLTKYKDQKILIKSWTDL